jgi:hypothetical protein
MLCGWNVLLQRFVKVTLQPTILRVLNYVFGPIMPLLRTPNIVILLLNMHFL